MTSKSWGEELWLAIIKSFLCPLLAVLGLGMGYLALMLINNAITSDETQAAKVEMYQSIKGKLAIQPAMRGVMR